VTHQYYVYIMASRGKTLYVGVTNNLERRVYEHKSGLVSGFTKKYKVTKLVYHEETSDVGAAIFREKQLKAWRRSKKVALVASVNPIWEDMALRWYSGLP
jgi:putative endonuclease